MSSHLLPRLFPVPRILAMDGGGIDISDRSIRYFLFDVLANRREISTFGEVILPKGAIEGGDIRDRDSVVRALMQVRARCGFSFCYVSLPEQKGYIFDTTYDPNHSPPLDQAIEMALFEQVPMSPAEMVFDCEVVQGENEASANALAITAFPETLAQDYVDLLITAGFMPLSLELEPQAASRALLYDDARRSQGAQVLIGMGLNETIFSIVENDSVRFTTSAAGSDALDAAIRAEIPTTAGRGDVAWIEAEVLRRKYEEGLDPESSVLKPSLDYAKTIAAALQRVAVYWQSRVAHDELLLPISEAWLYGINAPMRGIAEHLSQTSRISSAVADLRPALGGEGKVPPILRNDSLHFATVIGLALRAASLNVL